MNKFLYDIPATIMQFNYEGGKTQLLQVATGCFAVLGAYLFLGALSKKSLAGMLGTFFMVILGTIFTIFPNAFEDIARWLGGMFLS